MKCLQQIPKLASHKKDAKRVLPVSYVSNIFVLKRFPLMKTKAIKDNIRQKMKDFTKRDPRKFPQIFIKVLSRRRPSGVVYLVRGKED